MDIIPFAQLTLNGRFIMRWLWSGLILYIPILNFFSLGFLSRTSRLVTIGGVGLPTWEEKYATWVEGIQLLFVFILYNAVPFFMFSAGFFLTTLNPITAFFGRVVIYLSYAAFVVCSFLIPFAFAVFSEELNFKTALEFERIFRGIKEVFLEYLIGYAVTLCALYICRWIMRIPPFPLGFVLSSTITYYVLLLSTYYFTELYKKTTLAVVQMTDEIDVDGQ